MSLPDNVKPITLKAVTEDPKTGKRLDFGGGPPDDGNMNARVTALETRLDTILPTLATKSDMEGVRADLHKVSSDISRWTLATMLTIIGTMLAAIFGINQVYKTNSAASPQAQAPIIINVPNSGQQPTANQR